MNEKRLTKDIIEKRLPKLEKMAEIWEKSNEYQKGYLEGTIKTADAFINLMKQPA
ncbi:hypothetical protein [Lachnotalea glycerini]|uniref:hypothetical protein n=1 Tax=Lachnotalea glycerini TaxID=1763509 RepID=UPI0015F28814|nr:hypothetical protein [Lachnotalea glycerini]